MTQGDKHTPIHAEREVYLGHGLRQEPRWIDFSFRPQMTQEHIFSPEFVSALFDEMSASYTLTNYFSSFGFCERWRRQTVEGVQLHPDATVVEWMCGMGECWRFIAPKLHGGGRIIAVDFSAEMCRRANSRKSRFPDTSIEVRQGDALDSSLPDAMADCLIASFGLKTFAPDQLQQFADETWRILKPRGTFSFVEIAVPPSRILRLPYLFYLRYCIPLIGRMFLGNPDNYRLLSVYTEYFGKGDSVVESLRQRGFALRVENLFGGCARRLLGEKP